MLIGSVITTFTNPLIAAFFDVMQAQKLLMLLSTTGLALTQLGMLLPSLGYRGMLVLCTLHSVIGAHNFPTFDASTTAVAPSRYGDVRLFGSAAFGVAAFGGGGLISLAGSAPARSTFNLAFTLASALQLLSLPLITRIDFSALHASKKQTASAEATDATMAKESKPSGVSALIRMAADPKMLYFMVIVFLSGWQMSIIDVSAAAPFASSFEAQSSGCTDLSQRPSQRHERLWHADGHRPSTDHRRGAAGLPHVGKDPRGAGSLRQLCRGATRL